MKFKLFSLVLTLAHILSFSNSSSLYAEEGKKQAQEQEKENVATVHVFADPYNYISDPFEEMRTLQRYMNRFFDTAYDRDSFYGQRGGFSLSPNIDMYETSSDVIIKCDLPGMNKDKIDISINNDVLTISGKREREEHKEADKDGYTYYHQSVSYGQFSQSVRLPENIDSTKIDATYENGVLKITIPKKEPEEKKIQIKVK